MTITSFAHTQHAVEILFDQYDVLINDYSRHESCTILAARHQIERAKIVRLINDRDAGIIGSSGDTSFWTISTPAARVGAAA